MFKKLALLACVFVCLKAEAQSCTTAVCTASSASESAVLAAMPSNSNTNATVVVNIPAGTASWTSDFIYTIPSAVTNLTIKGATTITWTGTAGTSSWNYSANDQTIIQDADPGNNSLIAIQTGGSSTFLRITGLTIKSTTGGNKYSGGEVGISGGSHNFRFDHIHITGSGHQNEWLRVVDSVIGVVDHNAGDENPNNSNGDNYFQAFDPVDDNIGWGDGAWADASLWGTINFLFIEDNYLNGGAGDDCAEAGRFVMRYNTLANNYVAIQTHGTKSDAGAGRGCRAFEAYHNYITGPTGAATGDAPIGSKAGPALIWGNSMPQGFYRFFVPSTDRNIGPPPNVNESAGQPTDWGYCGTVINGTGSTWDGNQTTSLGWPCLDGIGRSKGDALNGANTIAARVNTVTGTQSWPHQQLEPVYLWMNNVSPSSGVEVNPRDNSTTADRDYYSECNTGFSDSTCPTTAFNGTHGTGYGTLANRPSTCKAGIGGTYATSPTGSYGVAYWATDANSGNGELYVCTATNTWTAVYQPYTYPHPLDSSLTSTSTSLSASNTTPVAGTNITLTATVSPSSGPTGTVSFYDTGTLLGSSALSSGTATWPVNGITGGVHGYTATYSGDSTYASSTSSQVTVTATSTGTQPPTFSPGGGTYTSAQTVTVSCPTSSSVCFCTTNGSSPNLASTQYTNGAHITIASTTTLQCMAAVPVINQLDAQNNNPSSPGTFWKAPDCISFSGTPPGGAGCSSDDPGGTGLPTFTSHSSGNATPSPDGSTTMEFNETPQANKQTNILFPTSTTFAPWSNNWTHIKSTFQMYLYSSTGISSVETDNALFAQSPTCSGSSGCRWMFGAQNCRTGCPGGHAGEMDFGGNSNLPWTYSGINVLYPVNQWFTVTFLLHFEPSEATTKPCTDSSGNHWPYLYYDAYIFNGTTYNNGGSGWKFCANALPTGWSQGGVTQTQLDGYPTASPVNISAYEAHIDFLTTSDPSSTTSATYTITPVPVNGPTNFSGKVTYSGQIKLQ